METLKDLQRKIDSMGEEPRQEFQRRFEEGDKNGKGPLNAHQRRLTTRRKIHGRIRNAATQCQ